MMDTSQWYAIFLPPPEQKEASLKQTRVSVGLDIDDTQPHGSSWTKPLVTALSAHVGRRCRACSASWIRAQVV